RLRMPPQMRCEAGRGGEDLDDEVEKLRICLEKREELHARRQPGEEAVEMDQRLVGRCGARQPVDDLRLELAEEGARPLAAGRRDVALVPAADLARGVTRALEANGGEAILVDQRLEPDGSAAGAGREELLAGLVDAREAV